MLNGMRTLFALEMWLSTSLQSFKNSIEDESGWVAQTVAQITV